MKRKYGLNIDRTRLMVPTKIEEKGLHNIYKRMQQKFEAV
jgi:hypothetical protein